MSEGWILIHRKILECDIWDNDSPFDFRSAWIDLLLLTNHKDVDTIFDYKPITIKRGQYLTSVRKLSKRWGWGKDKTLKYLRLLETLGMITKDSDSRRTLITVEKYDDYQCDPNTKQTVSRTVSRHSADTVPPQTNNEKNEKNEKNIYICSFDEFWKIYPRKQDKGQAYKQYLARLNDGYTEDQLLTACKNYAAECEREKREQKYIKHGKTFLSINEPFKDYLERTDDSDSRRRTDEDQAKREYEEYAKSEYFRSGGELPFV